MKEVNGDVEISWGVHHLDSADVQLTPSFTQVYPHMSPEKTRPVQHVISKCHYKCMPTYL